MLMLEGGGDANRAYRNAVLHACRNDMRWDRQCEDGRAPYLFDVLHATGEPEWYAPQIIDALNRDDAGLALYQITELVTLLARHGDEDARRALRAALPRWASGSVPNGFDRASLVYQAVESLTAVEGVSALPTMAAFLAEHPVPEDDRWHEYLLLDHLFERYGREQTRATLHALTAGLPPAAAYVRRIEADWAAWKADLETSRHTPKEPPPPYDEIRRQILDVNNRVWVSRLRRWGREINDETAALLAADLLSEPEPARQKLYLALFDTRPFPLDHGALIALARETTGEGYATDVAFRAARALRNLTHRDIRAFGYELSALPNRADEGVDLLVRNPGPGDETLMESLLHSTQNLDILHRLGMAVRDYFEENPKIDGRRALAILYEHGSCSMCRHSVVRLLQEHDAVPTWMRAECAYDADKHLRTLLM